MHSPPDSFTLNCMFDFGCGVSIFRFGRRLPLLLVFLYDDVAAAAAARSPAAKAALTGRVAYELTLVEPPSSPWRFDVLTGRTTLGAAKSAIGRLSQCRMSSTPPEAADAEVIETRLRSLPAR